MCVWMYVSVWCRITGCLSTNVSCTWELIVNLSVNSLDSKGNYSATSNNTKLIQCSLMGGLLHLVHSEEGPGRAAAPPSPLLAVPNVTAHPSMASVPITLCLWTLCPTAFALNQTLQSFGSILKLTFSVQHLTFDNLLFIDFTQRWLCNAPQESLYFTVYLLFCCRVFS